MAEEQKDSETKERLLACAKKEFVEKGYAKASLRAICREAGVTTGALYFFFQDKDDLFCSLVSHVLIRVRELIAAHRETEADEAAKSVISSGHDDSSEVELTKILVHELYRNREEVLLLINGAGGSSMENAVDLIIDEMDEHNLMLTKAMCDELQIPMIHHALVHWMSHNQVDMFLYMIQHIEEEEQALAFAGQAMNYLLGGWYGMFGVRANRRPKASHCRRRCVVFDPIGRVFCARWRVGLRQVTYSAFFDALASRRSFRGSG